LVKLLLIGAAGLGALGTGYYLHSKSASKPSTSTAGLSAPVRNPGSPAVNRAADDTTAPATPTPGVTPFESLERERPSEPAHRAANAPAAPSAPAASISSEIRMLDAARRAQANGDGAGAIRALDEYKKQYPRGVLAEESVLLRIEALAKLGNLPAARALAQKFRAAHPDSPHLRRIDSVLGE
jgi:TolA-binding protein